MFKKVLQAIDLQQYPAGRLQSRDRLSGLEWPFKDWLCLFNSLPEAVAILDGENNVLAVNRPMEELLGLRQSEIQGRKCWEVFHGPGATGLVENCPCKRMADSKTIEKSEIQIQSLDSCCIVSCSPVLDSDRKVELIVHSFTDISDRKSEADNCRNLLVEKELLLKEVHHRIKNNMNSVQCLLDLQASYAKETEAVSALENAGSRIRSIMLLYDSLFRFDDHDTVPVGEFLPSLVDEIAMNFRHGTMLRIEKNIENFTLDAKRLQNLVIIINELLTNIMKYAFVGRVRGAIAVSIALVDNRVCLTIEDDGIGIPDSVNFENSSGFGLTLVGELAKQLHGSIRIERGEGTRFILTFERS